MERADLLHDKMEVQDSLSRLFLSERLRGAEICTAGGVCTMYGDWGGFAMKLSCCIPAWAPVVAGLEPRAKKTGRLCVQDKEGEPESHAVANPWKQRICETLTLPS